MSVDNDVVETFVKYFLSFIESIEVSKYNKDISIHNLVLRAIEIYGGQVIGYVVMASENT